MPRRGLTSEWSIDLDGSFKSRIVDGSLQMVSPGPPVRTVWINVWASPAHRSPDEVLQEILQDVNPTPKRRFREAGTDAEELRYASWYAEVDGEREQWGLRLHGSRGLLCSSCPADRHPSRPRVGAVHVAVAALHVILRLRGCPRPSVGSDDPTGSRLEPLCDHAAVHAGRGDVRGLVVPAPLVRLIETGRWKHPGETALARVVPWFEDPLDFLTDTHAMARQSRALDRLADDESSARLFHWRTITPTFSAFAEALGLDDPTQKRE